MSYEDEDMFGTPVERTYRLYAKTEQGTRGYVDVNARSEAEAERVGQQNVRAYNAMEKRELREREAAERRDSRDLGRTERRRFGSDNPFRVRRDFR